MSQRRFGPKAMAVLFARQVREQAPSIPEQEVFAFAVRIDDALPSDDSHRITRDPAWIKAHVRIALKDYDLWLRSLGEREVLPPTQRQRW